MADLAWRAVLGVETRDRYVAHVGARVRLVVDAAPYGRWIWWLELRGERTGWIAKASGPGDGEAAITELDVAQCTAERAARHRALL